MHRFGVKTIKATQNSKRDQITMNLHRFDVQTIKNVELRRKPFKTAKLQKWSKYNDFNRFDVKNFKTMQNYKNYQITWIASIWRENDKKCWVTSQTNSKPLNYKSDQNTMTFTDLMSKTSKQHKTTKIIKLHELHRFDVQTI